MTAHTAPTRTVPRSVGTVRPHALVLDLGDPEDLQDLRDLARDGADLPATLVCLRDARVDVPDWAGPACRTLAVHIAVATVHHAADGVTFLDCRGERQRALSSAVRGCVTALVELTSPGYREVVVR